MHAAKDEARGCARSADSGASWLLATGDLRTAPILVDESPLGWQAATPIAYAHGFQVYSTDDGQNWVTADYQHERTGDWEKA